MRKPNRPSLAVVPVTAVVQRENNVRHVAFTVQSKALLYYTDRLSLASGPSVRGPEPDSTH